MTHNEIKAIIDEVGMSYFDKYDGLFDSSISNEKAGRYSLKVVGHSVKEPEEFKGKRIKVRIYTENFKAGNQCKEIGITGRYIFDKLNSENIFNKNIYLLQSTKEDKITQRSIISRVNCPNSYGFRIDAPYYATVLNLHDTPANEKKDLLKKFVAAYFEQAVS